jgi:hypothetical protein
MMKLARRVNAREGIYKTGRLPYFLIGQVRDRMFVSSMILTLSGPAKLIKIIPDDFVIQITHEPTDFH